MQFKRKKVYQIIACYLAINIISQAIAPSMALALTSGPSQPEASAFEPSGTTQMVDMFSGDFTYNIPLFELPGPDGGYPFNLAYHSGIGMDQEASWVGLGWNINPGAINRQVRGIPDEFKGDQINVQQDMKAMHNFGVNAGGGIEIFGGDALKGSLNLNASLYYNNYRGFGFGTGVGMSLSNPDAENAVSGGIGLSFDSQNGVGGKLSLGYEQANASLGFNSERGVDASFGVSLFNHENVSDDGNYTLSIQAGGSILGSPTTSYSPSVGMEYQTIPLSVNFKSGGGVGVFGNGYVGGFYTLQKLKDKEYSRKAYGYFYLEDDSRDDKSLMDFNREKQTLIHEKTPNLAIPTLTADFYSFSGQGTGGMFRAWRSDYGSVHDPYAESSINGGSIGVDLGVPHFGLEGSYQQGKSKSGKWDALNGLKNHFQYAVEKSGSYEPAYFKLYGEKSIGSRQRYKEIGGEQAVRPRLVALGNGDFSVAQNFIDENGTSLSTLANSVDKGGLQRIVRGQNIEQIPNSWLLNGSGEELLKEYKVEHYSGVPNVYSEPANTLNRSNSLVYKPHHFAGMTVVNKNGQRYVYGLPAMNKRKVEAVFSVGENATDCRATTPISQSGSLPNYKVSGTDEYLQYTETPSYAHSYLLTCVLGQDYVDVNDNGPDEADYGYWVKFTYTKAYSNYKWRVPYADAGFNMGVKTKYGDNKGNYSYGEKEVWYVTRAETKSHVAVFKLSDARTDALDAAGEFASGTAKGAQKMYKLNEIKLFTRSEYAAAVASGESNSTPLQTIKFEYDNSLCEGVDNAVSGSGKLTLKKVGFYYQNNLRGLLNKYTFKYGSANPGYDNLAYDRWGNYSPVIASDFCANRDLPYVRQFDRTTNQSEVEKESYQTKKNNEASAWHLSEIETPTGSTISIAYEADDYAYVQHREATQMFYVNKLDLGTNVVYNNGGAPNGNNTRIYFKLEDPIPTSVANPGQLLYEKYLRGLERIDGNSKYVQLYFKSYVNLRDNVWEYVSGYSNLKNNGYGIDMTRTASIDVKDDGSSSAVNCYTHGYVEIEPYHDEKHNRDYHPIAALAWQKMRMDHPDLLLAGGKIDVDAGSSDFDKAMKVKSLVNAIPQITQLVKGYLKRCYDKGWAKNIDLSKSVIRLCSPDQKKFGGGVRVKQISTSDNFSVDGSEDVYGHVYDYTKLNENGDVISSGVASYEPMIGGEENPLRYAKTYTDDQSFKSNNNLYFEYPINESYYPSPSVGYSKVTVRSIATQKVLEGTLSDEIGITGETVYEFYTAKDFPTIASETQIDNQPWHRFIPIPLVGSTQNDKLTASQGYKVEVNDMHGKQKSITYYGAADGNIMTDFPVSSITYQYKANKKSYEGEVVNQLQNDVMVPSELYDNEFHTLGVDYEFFVDHLRSESYQVTGGISGNLETFGFIPLPEIWPSYSQGKTMLRTMVFNKVIHRAAIMDRTIASDGQSTVTTRNIGFDPYTGEAILTKTTNNYGKELYNVKAYANSFAIMNSDELVGRNLDEDAGLDLGAEEDKKYVTQPSFEHYGSIQSITLSRVDTTDGKWAEAEFFKFGKEGYSKLYYINNTLSGAFSPGDQLSLTTSSGSFLGQVLQIGRDSAFGGVDRIAFPAKVLYSSDPVPTGTLISAMVIKPGAENVLNMQVYDLSSFGLPATQVTGNSLTDQLNMGALGFLPSAYIDSVIQTSPILQYSEGKPYREIKGENPYRSGERGRLELREQWDYKQSRKFTGDLGSDGIYRDGMGSYHFYYPTWVNADYLLDTWGGSKIENHPFWTKTQEFTKYDTHGHNVEAKNSLGVYSSAGYAHYGTSMSWRANNAKEEEVFFISFEDSEYQLADLSDVVPAASFGGHTGKKSLEVDSDSEFKIDLKPQEDKVYFFSAWIKANEETHDYSKSIDANTRGVELKFYNKDYSINRGNSSMLKPVGPIIEGWQKIEGKFMVASSTADPVESLSIVIYSGAEGEIPSTINIDDIRIMPNDANMTSYAYDPATFRLSATLDENNFASFYYYDEEGKLFLVKKETEKGIYTIQENRSYQ